MGEGGMNDRQWLMQLADDLDGAPRDRSGNVTLTDELTREIVWRLREIANPQPVFSPEILDHESLAPLGG